MLEDRKDRTGTLILNINDGDATRYMITRVLQRAGFTVIEAVSGYEGLEKVRTEKPKVVVLDIKLPDIDGLKICRQIKADPETRSVKVLHTSAVFVATEYKVQSLECGADGYLTHPFEQEELIATIRSLLRLTDAEQRLLDYTEELKAINRRTNEFLAMLAHELRNPLAAIVSSLPLLARRATQDPVELTARELIKRQTTHLSRLVEDLLDVARVTQGKIELKQEPVDLVVLLQRCAANIRQTRTDSRGQILRLVLPAIPVYVRGDQTRLEQIFANLLDNASKYTDDNGDIRLELQVLAAHDPAKQHPSAAHHADTSKSGGSARIVVRDSGIGMSASTLPNIFNLFSQSDDVPLARTRGGLGIGLTLVRTLVNLHGGSIRAHSEGIGRGSEFEVLLPLHEECVETSVAQSSVTGEESPRRRRVLLVEDNLDAQQAMKCLLELWGHEVAVAADGLAGITTALALQPDIALVDIGLPSVDGFEVARQIRKSPTGKSLLLVALTGYGAQEQRTKALEAGFDLHLVKPIEPDELCRLVAECAPEGAGVMMGEKG